MIEYSIEVLINPHPWDDPKDPYFWWIKRMDTKGNVTNTGLCGWAETPDKAWEAARTASERL